ncbi:hypothetical protein DSM100238_0145 [Bifidobacterium apri]|uniref:Uncharacterized protein n=1 Tax=Bifidobacterium apri TaxID=1769423 RepID=A0A6A2VBD9_9BIFI|nr:hypothetical protein DSM100238_0145 [Bifidobacterium apri]
MDVDSWSAGRLGACHSHIIGRLQYTKRRMTGHTQPAGYRLISPSSAASSDCHAYHDIRDTTETTGFTAFHAIPHQLRIRQHTQHDKHQPATPHTATSHPATYATTYTTRQKPPDFPTSMPFPTSHACHGIRDGLYAGLRAQDKIPPHGKEPSIARTTKQHAESAGCPEAGNGTTNQ